MSVCAFSVSNGTLRIRKWMEAQMNKSNSSSIPGLSCPDVVHWLVRIFVLDGGKQE